MAAPTKATLKLSPFTINIPEETLQEFKTLLKLSKLPPPTYEGTKEEFGVTREWMAHAKEEWEKFDWYPTFPSSVAPYFPLKFLALTLS